MRKSFLLIFIAVMTFSVPCFCAEVEEPEQIDKTWNDIGKQGKQLLKDFGNFFKNAGERMGKDLEDARTNGRTRGRIYDSWLYSIRYHLIVY